MIRKKRILVASTQRSLAQLIALALQRHGHEALIACPSPSSDHTTLHIVRREQPDLIILDVLTPGLPGSHAAAQLRADARTAAIPILLLTDKTPQNQPLSAPPSAPLSPSLSAGADDYLTKPVCMKVLAAHVTALLRRQAAAEPAVLGRAGPLVIDRTQHEVTLQGRPINLTATEYNLLAALVAARGRALSRQKLIDRVMGNLVTSRAIDVHITSLRKKLGKFAWMVHTVRGIGYGLREQRNQAGNP